MVPSGGVWDGANKSHERREEQTHYLVQLSLPLVSPKRSSGGPGVLGWAKLIQRKFRNPKPEANVDNVVQSCCLNLLSLLTRSLRGGSSRHLKGCEANASSICICIWDYVLSVRDWVCLHNFRPEVFLRVHASIKYTHYYLYRPPWNGTSPGWPLFSEKSLVMAVKSKLPCQLSRLQFRCLVGTQLSLIGTLQCSEQISTPYPPQATPTQFWWSGGHLSPQKV